MNKNKNGNGVRQKNKFSCHWIWTGRRFYMSSGEKDKRFMVDRIAALRSILFYGKLQKKTFGI